MKKKAYIAPETEYLSMEAQTLMAGSADNNIEIGGSDGEQPDSDTNGDIWGD